MASSLRSAAGVLLLLAAASSIAAHPYHTTVAEAEYNPTTNHLEIALRVMPEDLEEALAKHLGRQLILEREEGLEAHLAAYLSEVFELNCGNRKSTLEWAGMELETKQVWLYFELTVPAGHGSCTLANRVFFALSKRQINTVVLDMAGNHRTLTFTTEQATHELTF